MANKLKERNNFEESSINKVTQLWKKSGSCPKGTIPVRRIRKSVLLKANNVENYGRKRQRYATPQFSTHDNKNLSVQLANHSVIILTSSHILMNYNK